jgi:hypothetical protein
MGAKRGIDQGDGTVNVFICAFILYMLSANNIDLCLGNI